MLTLGNDNHACIVSVNICIFNELVRLARVLLHSEYIFFKYLKQDELKYFKIFNTIVKKNPNTK